MAWFTGVLALVALLQLWLLGRQFVATFRPKIIVRQVSIISSGGRYSIEFSVANDGGTYAKIIKSRAVVLLRESAKALPPQPLEGGIAVVAPQKLKAGTSIVVSWRDDYTTKRVGELTNEGGGMTNLFFVGEITYRDGAGVVRQTGFFRRYSWEHLRFRTVDDPDFNYAD